MTGSQTTAVDALTTLTQQLEAAFKNGIVYDYTQNLSLIENAIAEYQKGAGGSSVEIQDSFVVGTGAVSINCFAPLLDGKLPGQSLSGTSLVSQMISSVTLTLTTAQDAAKNTYVSDVKCALTLGPDESWSFGSIGEATTLSATLSSIIIDVTRPAPPATSGSKVQVTVAGSCQLASAKCALNAIFPSGAVSAKTTTALKLDDLLTLLQLQSLGLPSPGVSSELFFKPGFTLSANVQTKDLSLSGAVVAGSMDLSKFTENKGITSLEMISDVLDLGLGQAHELTINFARAGTNINASLSGTLIVENALALDANATFTDKSGTQAWEFTGSYDGDVTWELVNNSTPAPSPPTVSLAQLATQMFSLSPGELPGGLSDIELSAFSVDYTYTKPGGDGGSALVVATPAPQTPPDLTVKGTFDDQWMVDGIELSGEVTFTLTHTPGDANGVAASVSAVENIDGFECTLGADLKSGIPTICASVSKAINTPVGVQMLKASGTYTTNPPATSMAVGAVAAATGGIATLTLHDQPPSDPISLETVVCWAVSEASGNPFLTLPAPWDSLLRSVSLNPGQIISGYEVSFTYNTASRKVGFSLAKAATAVDASDSDQNLIDAFGLITVSGVGFDYQKPTGSQKGAGLEMTLTGTFLNLPGTTNGGKTIAFNPCSSAPPAVPGSNAAALKIHSLVAGQRLEYSDIADSDVQTVVSKLASVAKTTATSGFTLGTSISYDASSEWLLAGSATILGKVNLQFAFDDPDLYGVYLSVTKGGKPSKLDALVGLTAEILYRKASPTVGEYQGTLTLPQKIRKINYGALEITLPSFGLSIYTNGDFAINVGFPENLDFTHSFSVLAGEYGGAGGFYYKKLDGLAVKGLPAIQQNGGVPIGEFNSTTELGIGFKAGLARNFSKGPLSATASIMLEGLFQGIFAQFTNYADGSHAEFFEIDAALGIIGHIQGKANFGIASASLVVTVQIVAQTKIIAYQDIPVTFTADVSASVTISINCGLFSINIHCSFSATYSDEITLKSPLHNPPWNLGESQLSTLTPPGATAAPTPDWIVLAPSNPVDLSVFLLPKATYADGSWAYVAQFGLDVGESGTSYEDLAKMLTIWALGCLTGQASTCTTLDQVGSLSITTNDVDAFLTGLATKTATWPADPTLFTNQCKKSFSLTLSNDLSTSADFAFIPAFAGLQFSINGQTPTDPASDVQEAVWSDYCQVILKSTLHQIIAAAPSNDTPQTVTNLLTRVTDFAQPVMNATRMLLNGNMWVPQTGPSSPLYAATGQQIPFSTSGPNAPTSLDVLYAEDPVLPWTFNGAHNSSFPGLSTVIQAGSEIGPKAAMLPTGWYTTHPSSISTPFSFATYYAPVARAPHFSLTMGAAYTGGNSIWGLHSSVQNALQGANSIKVKSHTKGSQDKTLSFTWALNIACKVKKQPGAAGVYRVTSVDKAGLQRLQAFLAELDAAATKSNVVTQATLAQKGPDGLTITSIADPSLFFVSSAYPPNDIDSTASDAATVAARILTLSGLGDISSSFLFAQTALADDLFDSSGQANLNVVFELAQGHSNSSYVNTVIVDQAVPAAATNFYITTPSNTREHSALHPGSIGIEITRPTPAPPKTPQTITPPGGGTLPPCIQDSIEQLYTVMVVSLTVPPGIAASAPVLTANVCATTDPDTPQLTYTHVFEIIPANALSGDTLATTPPADQNPYKVMLADYDIVCTPTDLFGNSAPDNVSGSRVTPVYTDPIISPLSLPGLSITYGFSHRGAGDSALTVQLSFAFPTSAEAPDTPSAPPLSTLQKYANAIYQMSVEGRPQIGVQVHCSLFASPLSKDIATAYLGQLEQIYAALANAYNTNGTTLYVPVLAPIEIGLQSATSLNTKNKFQLTTELEFTRQRACAAFDPCIQTINVTLKPGSTTNTGTLGSLVLADFQTEFLACIANLQMPNVQYALAVGASNTIGEVKDDQIWVVSTLVGALNPSIGPTSATYAPLPLSTHSLSYFDPRIVGFDADAAMRQLMAAIDAFCAPGVLGLAMSLDQSNTINILTAKEDIITSLLPLVADLETGHQYKAGAAATVPQMQATAAAELVRTECQKSMVNFYKLGSAIVLDTTVASAPVTPEFRALFQPSISNPAQGRATVSFTPFKSVLSSTPTYAAFGLYISDIDQFDAFQETTLTLAYQNAEIALSEISIGNATYQGGDWLKLVSGQSQSVSVALNIAAPLRAFPQSPQLASPVASYASTTFTPGQTASEKIAQVKEWSLATTYIHQYVTEDTVAIGVLTASDQNFGAAPVPGTETKAPDLICTLQSFADQYAKIQPSLASLSTGNESAIGAFFTLISSLSEDISSFVSQMSFSAPSATFSDCLSWTATDAPTQITELQTTVVARANTAGNTAGFWPSVGFQGFDATSNTDLGDEEVTYTFATMSPTQAENYPRRTLEITPLSATKKPVLNVIDWHWAKLGLQVVRNPDYFYGFQCRTPIVTSPNALMPFIECDAEIDCTDLLGTPSTLSAYMQAILGEVLSTATASSTNVALQVQIGVGLSLPAATQVATLLAVDPSLLPAMMLYPTDVKSIDAGSTAPSYQFVTDFVSALDTWLTANKLDPTTQPALWATKSSASLLFNILLFGSQSAEARPILRLSRLSLPCGQVSSIT